LIAESRAPTNAPLKILAASVTCRPFRFVTSVGIAIRDARRTMATTTKISTRVKPDLGCCRS
jgi:hypothetical protein